MASIIDSFRETFNDNHSFLKLLVFAAPIYYSYYLFISAKGDFDFFWFVASLTVFFLFGFLIKTTSGVLNERDTVIPSLNPFKLAWAALKGLVAIGPVVGICIFIASKVCPLINIISWLDITLISIIWLIVLSISLTAFLLFVKGEKIADAYNLKVISDKSGDLMVGVLFFVIQLIVVNLPTTGFIGYTVTVLFGVGPILYAFFAYAIAFNIAVTGHYMAQLQYELLGFDKNKF